MYPLSKFMCPENSYNPVSDGVWLENLCGTSLKEKVLRNVSGSDWRVE